MFDGPKKAFLTFLEVFLQGSLSWAYMQMSNFMAAEVIYRKAQMIDADSNKACNLAYCLIKQSRYDEARSLLEQVSSGSYPGCDDPKNKIRVENLMSQLDAVQPPSFLPDLPGIDLEDDFVNGLDRLMSEWGPPRSKRLPIFEELTPFRGEVWFVKL